VLGIGAFVVGQSGQHNFWKGSYGFSDGRNWALHLAGETLRGATVFGSTVFGSESPLLVFAFFYSLLSS
jgi:hypothetical protein